MPASRKSPRPPHLDSLRTAGACDHLLSSVLSICPALATQPFNGSLCSSGLVAYKLVGMVPTCLPACHPLDCEQQQHSRGMHNGVCQRWHVNCMDIHTALITPNQHHAAAARAVPAAAEIGHHALGCTRYYIVKKKRCSTRSILVFVQGRIPHEKRFEGCDAKPHSQAVEHTGQSLSAISHL
jgi:hypothetical protein